MGAVNLTKLANPPLTHGSPSPISPCHDHPQQVAKENWQKYGNPDGKQALEVSIGLPTFLLDKENHTTILLAYLIVLVVLIPLGKTGREGGLISADGGLGDWEEEVDGGEGNYPGLLYWSK